MAIDFKVMVAGEAGQGVQSMGFLLAKVFSRSGYYVFADQDYESRIRGGHNFYRIRIKDSDVGAISEEIDILIALDGNSVKLHGSDVVQDGFIVFNSDEIKNVTASEKHFTVPLNRIVEEMGLEKITANTIALGAVLGIVGYKMENAEDVIREFFGSGDIGASNTKALRAGFQYAESNFTEKLRQRISPLGNIKRMLLNGNEAIALGAIAADCKFMAAYPMTPSTAIMEYIASMADRLGIVVVQPEDEIAAVNMIIGASYVGVRAMTATSGSGFCLMVEGLGLAGITETPIVIVDGQRPGPAVGLPSRTEQGDLLFAVHAHHGDFPRAVLAPANVEDAFWVTIKAFDLADKYQIPVIILTDQHLASSYSTVNKFELSRIIIDRGRIFSADDHGSPSLYMRHKVTETGISPRAFPGDPNALVVTDADEHDEFGHLIEDEIIRTEQMQKRLRKIVNLRKEISPPGLYGPKEAETTLIGWGSTCGALREAVAIMLEDGASVNMLSVNEIWPFPSEVITGAIDTSSHCFVVENNATGQLSRLIKQETGRAIDDRILKFNGRPFTPEQIITELKGVY